MLTALALAAAFLTSAPVPKFKPPPMLQVRAFESSVVLGDPVDLQVDFVNTKSETVLTKNEITHPTLGSFWVEVKPADEETFRKIRLVEYEISDIPSKTYRVKYPPGESCVQHLFVHRGEKGKLHLPTAGRWRLRVVIDTSDGLIHSEAIEITIADATEARLKALEKRWGHVTATATFRGHAPARDLSVLKADRAEFDGSYLGRLIDDSLLVRDYLDATTPATKTEAREAIDRRIGKLSGGPRDLIVIDYAWALADRGEADAARTVMESVRIKFDTRHVEDAIRNAEKQKR